MPQAKTCSKPGARRSRPALRSGETSTSCARRDAAGAAGVIDLEAAETTGAARYERTDKALSLLAAGAVVVRILRCWVKVPQRPRLDPLLLEPLLNFSRSEADDASKAVRREVALVDHPVESSRGDPEAARCSLGAEPLRT